MKILGECGLISTRKEAKWSHYSLNCDQWTAFRDYIESIRCTCATDEKGGCCCT
jgi:ArsR family transcriptional regulator